MRPLFAPFSGTVTETGVYKQLITESSNYRTDLTNKISQYLFLISLKFCFSYVFVLSYSCKCFSKKKFLKNACTLNYLAFVIFIGKWFITQYLRYVHSGIVYRYCCIAIKVYITKKDNFKCF